MPIFSMDVIGKAADSIEKELEERLAYFDQEGKPLERTFGTTLPL